MSQTICQAVFPLLEKKTWINQVDVSSFFDDYNAQNIPWVLITDSHFYHYGSSLLPDLSMERVIVIPEGESSKNYHTKIFIENSLFKMGYDKTVTLIALGGGVVCDVTGLVAANFYRGVRLILIPTTYLCMVDASLGGKCAINTEYGKNLIGAFYPAAGIVIDCNFAKTWSPLHLLEGLAEVIKIALIYDRNLFSLLEDSKESLIKQEMHIIEKTIFHSLRIKAEIVSIDPFDKGLRNLLNFGHTIAHAIEFVSNYRISHGMAVAIGLALESYISSKVSSFSNDSLSRVINLLKFCKYDFKSLHDINHDTLLHQITRDKKSLKSKNRFVVLKEIGSAESFDGAYCRYIEEDLIRESLDWIKRS